MKDGLLPVVAVAGAVSATLLWTMSANDPYWRLFDSPNLPAPAYTPSEDLRVVLKTETLELGNIDAGAMSPAADPLATAQRANIPLDVVLREAEAAAIPEPMIALLLPLEPELMAGPTVDSTIAYELPRTAILAPVSIGPEADVVIAFAPTPLPAPAAFRDRGLGVVAKALSENLLDPFVAPAPPAQPRFAASKITEDALALKRAARIDVQRRLALAGFDPNGIDGAFGPQTRTALADFQTAWGFPATGYLEASVYAELNQRTKDAYQALQRQAAAAPSTAPELAPIAAERQVASADVDDGRCARRSDGQIIERQSLACDLAGFSENFVSLGRNTLNSEEDGATDVTARTPFVSSSHADR